MRVKCFAITEDRRLLSKLDSHLRMTADKVDTPLLRAGKLRKFDAVVNIATFFKTPRNQMAQLRSSFLNITEVDWNTLPNVDVFARVTREGVTDFYLVQNHQGFCWNGRISIAFYMDDVNRNYPGDSYGVPMYLRQSDHIECLGTPKDYFLPASNRWDVKGAILRSLPRSAGLLPAVRAYETLVSSGAEMTDETISSAATAAYLDYVKRRSKLNDRTHRAPL